MADESKRPPWILPPEQRTSNVVTLPLGAFPLDDDGLAYIRESDLTVRGGVAGENAVPAAGAREEAAP